MLNKDDILNILEREENFADCLGLKKKDRQLNVDMRKKVNEVAGFCEQILKVVKGYDADREIIFLDCSCGKSYLSFVLNYILEKELKRKTFFYGVDTNKKLIRKCEDVCSVLGFRNMEFWQGKTIDFVPEREVDIVIALHACDTATDEAIANGIKIDAKHIMVVPCCQGQLRSQIKSNHPLMSITQFGLLRYKFADILTEALRSQFLMGNGYYVDLLEIVSPKFTPKNILISARKVKRKNKRNLETYFDLNSLFNTSYGLHNYFSEQSSNNSLAYAC